MHAHAWAPVRVGIAGGGTDLPAWTREHVGHCLSLAIATYAHAVVIPRPDGRVVASYRRLDEEACATEIANGLIRESALLHGFEDGFEVHTLSEISSRGSGLGVSSAIAVALAAAFSRVRDLREGKREADGCQRAAADAWAVEIDRLRRPIGRQDHMAAAWGGLRLYRFEGREAAVERTFSAEDATWVGRHVGLLELPDGHDSRVILSNVQRVSQLRDAEEAVGVAVRAIEERRVDLFGEALSLGQRSKVGIPGAVPREVEEAVRVAAACDGVHGCKVAGAGGGGHLVVACDGEDARRRAEAATRLAGRAVAASADGVRTESWP